MARIKSEHMKTISTLFSLILVTTILQAQTVYNVNSSGSWSYPTTCYKCTFNIASNATLVVNRNVILQNVTFNGGHVIVANNSITLQTSGGGRSYFNNTDFVFNNGSTLTGSAPMVLTNTDFTFKNTGGFVSQQSLDLTNSHINFYGDTYMLATGGPISLRSNSMLIAGDGTLSSDANIIIFGPQVTLYDNSSMIAANNNNYYYNWAPYYGDATHKYTYTLLSGLNCGGSYPNNCALATVYGPASMLPSGVISGNILPVVLSDFSARLVNNRTELNWTTDQENNSARFEVERSTDGTNWITIATVAAKGTSTTQSKYAAIDRSPAAGTNYYRLKMVDLDNRYDFSAVKSVHGIAVAKVRVYPNPAISSVNISLPASATAVRLVNTAGQVLQERRGVTGNSTLSLEVSSYTAGTYMVQVINTDGTSSNSVLLIAK
jgi:hypothetical protein